MKNVLCLLTPILMMSSSAMATNRPSSGTPLSIASEQCEGLSRRAESKKIKTLVITFEGLASYSGAATASAYAYADSMQNRKKMANPGSGAFTGFVTRGLVMPMTEKYGSKMEILIFANSDIGAERGSVPEICARLWMKGANDRKLVILGHSYGGHAAFQLATNLSNVKVDGVFTMDPRTKLTNVVFWKKPANVRVWKNYFQRNGFSLPGYPVGGAVNQSIGGFVGHLGMPSQAVIANDLSRYLSLNL